MTVFDYCLEGVQVLSQGDFGFESLGRFQDSVESLSPKRAFLETTSASNQTGWWLQYRISLQIALLTFEVHSAPQALILVDASSESPVSC